MNTPAAQPPQGPVTAEDLPLLGEPLAVELANSLYLGTDGAVDFLASPTLALLWLRSAPRARAVHVPVRLSRLDVARLRRLRLCVRSVLLALSREAPPDAEDIRMLNRFAAAAPSYASLEDAGGGRFVAVTRASAADARGLLGRLAHETIVLVGASPGPTVRRCEAPGCPMLFVKDHHRRRWCHESCGHRSRQSAYLQRRAARAPEEKT